MSTIARLIWSTSSAKGVDRLVLLALAECCDEANLACPSVPTLSAMTGVSVSTVRRSLRVLEGLGEIAVQAGGRHETNTYDLSPLCTFRPVNLTGLNESRAVNLTGLNAETGQFDRSKDIRPVNLTGLNESRAVNLTGLNAEGTRGGSDFEPFRPVNLTAYNNNNNNKDHDLRSEGDELNSLQEISDHFQIVTGIMPGAANFETDWRPIIELWLNGKNDVSGVKAKIDRAVKVARGENQNRKRYPIFSPRSLNTIYANLPDDNQSGIDDAAADASWQRVVRCVSRNKYTELSQPEKAALRAVDPYAVKNRTAQNETFIRNVYLNALRQQFSTGASS